MRRLALYAPVLFGQNYKLFTDDFNRADGALGNPWTGATWTISSNAAINTPTLGAEKLSNVEFTTNTTGWTAGDGSTLTRRDYTAAPDIDPTGGADDYGLEVASGGLVASCAIQNADTTIGQFYRASTRAYSPSANTGSNAAGLSFGNFVGGGSFYKTSSEDAWATLVFTGRNKNVAVMAVQLRCVSSTSGDKAHHDAPSMKQITFAEMLATVGNCKPDVDISVKITRSTRAVAGLVLCLDSAEGPTNFILAYLSAGDQAVLEKCVNGTYTTLIDTAITYSAGAALRVVKSGTSVDLYYNGSQVETTQTISDATIINNTRHGMLSTDATVSLDDFSVDKKKVG